MRRLGDDAKALQRAVSSSLADLIVTTGGTAGDRWTTSTPSCAAWRRSCSSTG